MVDTVAKVVAEAIGQAGYTVTFKRLPEGQPVATATRRDGKQFQVVADNELSAITELNRRFLLEDRTW